MGGCLWGKKQDVIHEYCFTVKVSKKEQYDNDKTIRQTISPLI